YRSGDNPARWKGNLDKVLPARSRVRSVQHHRALAYAETPDFVAKLQAQTGVAAQALAFTILTAGRTSEILSARWEEIDPEAKLWTIPASRMKAGKEHRVPLTSSALDILESRGYGKRAGLIFPHPTTASALSINAMRSVLLRMKVDVTVHGFRSAFRDWAAEKTSHANEVVEMALAHAIGSQVEAAYRRGDLLEKRRTLMKDWANFLTHATEA
ncbi:MAG: integrase, partial [Caulobacteraceae bacterium]